MKIYDAFIFNNELDLLDLRLHLLNDYVDKFVIAESNFTFSGKIKELFYLKNKHYFNQFNEKIIHLNVQDPPESFLQQTLYQNPLNELEVLKNNVYSKLESVENWNRNDNIWGREHFQRESIFLALQECEDNDIVLISDIDEFPNPNSFKSLMEIKENDVYEFRHKFFYYKLNLLKSAYIIGTKSVKYKSLKNNSIYNIRKKHNLTTKIMDDYGWHLSFMGGAEKIISKIESYSHQEFNNDHIKSNIESNIKNKKDLFFRDGELKEIDIYETYPHSFIELVKSKYSYLI